MSKKKEGFSQRLAAANKNARNDLDKAGRVPRLKVSGNMKTGIPELDEFMSGERKKISPKKPQIAVSGNIESGIPELDAYLRSKVKDRI